MKQNNQTLPTVCIVTIDPAHKGGILVVTKWVYQQLKDDGYAPVLVYNKVPSLRQEEEKVTFLKLLRGSRPSVHKENVDGMEGYAIDRVLPEFEFFNYVFNVHLWKKVLKKGYKCFVVGGTNNCALPLALLNKEFSVLIATTLAEERMCIIKREPIVRKIRDRTSLPILLLFENYIFKKARKIFSLSQYVNDKIVQKYNIDENKLGIVSYLTNLERFHPTDYRERKNDYILFTGKMRSVRKNLPLLLFAFAKIKSKYPHMKLKLVGQNSRERFMKIARTLNIDDAVEFLGNVNHNTLLQYYQNALLFVVPSLQEGLCIPALEALACGVPVVSTRCGGPEDFIENGYNGYLVRNNDSEDIARAVTSFLELSRETKRQMVKNARDCIKAHYTRGKIKPAFSEWLSTL